jgi:hypothetical protein
LVQPFKGSKRDTIGILGGAKCQIKSVHPAVLRLQKRAQRNSAAPHADLRSTGVTGAENRASPTPVRNVDLGDHKAWEVLPSLCG